MKAYELLADPESWIKGTVAKNKNNEPVKPLSQLAVKWCLIGAVYKCYPNNKFSMLTKLSNRIYDVSVWNDHPHTDHSMVISLLKELDI